MSFELITNVKVFLANFKLSILQIQAVKLKTCIYISVNVRQIFFGNKLPFMLLKQLLNYTVHAIFELSQFMLLNQPQK